MTVLGERDPAFDLPLEERFGITRDAKRRMHSSSIRKGIAESLALLGSRSRALSSCSHGKAQTIAVLTVRELLENADWKAWASLNNHLPLLAEAAPDEFMDAVEAALINSATSPFRDLFAQERPGITGRTYTSGLLWALETLAWNPDHLVRVTMLLGELAEIDPGGKWSNRPGNSLVDIFLPWHPQTSATIEKRKSAVEALFLEHPAVGWNLIIALLPQSHSSTSGTRRPSWRDFIPAKWSEDVTRQDYWTQIQGYAEVAINAATTDSTKLAQLLDRLADLPSPAYERVLEHLSSDQVVAMPESDRLPLWETLVDLSAKHKKFADAQWALPSENVSAIENAASKVAPRSIDLIHRRLFSARDFDLFEEKGDFEEQQRRLDQRRESAVAEILNKKGIPGIIDFAGHVGSPEEVGGALGKLEFNGLDEALMPTYLQEDDQTLAAFIRGYVWSRFWTKSWAWVDGLINDTWTIEQRTKFLVLLPFFEETWRRAERYLGSQESEYWKNARVNPWGPQQNLPDAAKKLLSNARPQAALACLDRLVHQKTDFPPELALQALLETVATQNGPDRLDQYDMINVIKWLQENPKTDRAELFKVEWAYLPLLDRHLGAAPRTLESRLATDPKFFCDIIAMIFRSDKGEKKPDQETSDTDAKIAQNAYRLLNEWQTVPGQKPDGSFDQAAFVEWLKEVKRRTADSGHLRIALSQVGQVLPYAPTDPDGLWIRRAVADALNAKDASNMRSGFTCELFNMRGVHGYTSGADERAIAARYNDQANNAENAGYHRLATALRELAASYERDADREAHRDPFDDR